MMLRPRRRLTRLIALCAVIVTLGGVGTAWFAVRSAETAEELAGREVTQRAERAATSIAQGLRSSHLLADAVVALYRSSGEVGDRELRRFVARQVGSGSADRFPGVEAVVVAARDMSGDLEVVQTAGASTADRLVGRDLSVLPELAETIGAVQPGEQLHSSTGLGSGDLTVVSIAPATAERRARWILIPLDRHKLVRTAFAGSGLRGELPAGTDSLQVGGPPDPDAPGGVQTVNVEFEDIRWSLRVSAAEGEISDSGDPWWAVAIGGLLTALVTALIWTLGVAGQRARQQVDHTTATLRAHESRYRSLASSAPIGMFHAAPEGSLEFANERLRDLTEGDDCLGGGLWELISPRCAEERIQIRADMEAGVETGGRVALDLRGGERWVDLRVAPVRDGSGGLTGWVGSVLDVTMEVAARQTLERQEAQARHRAYHDDLTGLPNRSFLEQRLREALAERSATLLFCDLDGFKVVNDSLGHEIGDEVLKAVAGRVQNALRAGDLVARLGGDEFAVLLPADDDSDEEADHVAQRIVDALDRPFSIREHRLSVSTSVGIATGEKGTDVTDMLRDADLAMYDAKAQGTGRVAHYRPELHEAVQRRLETEAALRATMARDALDIHLQPIIELSSGTTLAAEALVRWDRGDRIVSPAEFIPLAEERGLIGRLGEQVLDKALGALAMLDRAGLRVAVNVSAQQLSDDGFPALVSRALNRHDLPGAQLILEVTESALLAELDLALASLGRLRALGVQIAIDDFGAGYSSLGQLRSLPLDILKIDKSFVQGIHRGVEELAFVQAIVKLGSTLGLEVIAEGVETEDHDELVRRVECDLGQGYRYGRPMPVEKFADWVQDRPPHLAVVRSLEA